jgi:hypothetical protein
VSRRTAAVRTSCSNGTPGTSRRLLAVERLIPFYGLVHVGHRPHDELIEARPNGPLPAGHSSDVDLPRSVALALGICGLPPESSFGAASFYLRSVLVPVVLGYLVSTGEVLLECVGLRPAPHSMPTAAILAMEPISVIEKSAALAAELPARRRQGYVLEGSVWWAATQHQSRATPTTGGWSPSAPIRASP